MRCKQAERLLGEYLDGGLRESLSESVETHLRACAACRGELAALRLALQKVKSLPSLPLPEGFVERVGAAARRKLQEQLTPAPRKPFLGEMSRTLRWFAPAFGLLLIALVVWWQSPPRQEFALRGSRLAGRPHELGVEGGATHVSPMSVEAEKAERETQRAAPMARPAYGGPPWRPRQSRGLAISPATPAPLEPRLERGTDELERRAPKPALAPPGARGPAVSVEPSAGLPEPLKRKTAPPPETADQPAPDLVIPSPRAERGTVLPGPSQPEEEAVGFMERREADTVAPKGARQRAELGAQARRSGPPTGVPAHGRAWRGTPPLPVSGGTAREAGESVQFRARAESGLDGRPRITFRLATAQPTSPLLLRLTPSPEAARKEGGLEWQVVPRPNRWTETRALHGTGGPAVWGASLAHAEYRLFIPSRLLSAPTPLPIEYRGTSLEGALADLSERAGLVIMAPAPLRGEVHLLSQRLTAEQALETLASSHGFRIEAHGFARNLIPLTAAK